MASSQIRASQVLTEDGQEGCGLTTAVNAGQTWPCALGLPQSEEPLWVLKQELRLEILQWIPSGGGAGWVQGGRT